LGVLPKESVVLKKELQNITSPAARRPQKGVHNEERMGDDKG
jgi:hypothetical protein